MVSTHSVGGSNPPGETNLINIYMKIKEIINEAEDPVQNALDLAYKALKGSLQDQNVNIMLPTDMIPVI